MSDGPFEIAPEKQSLLLVARLVLGTYLVRRQLLYVCRLSLVSMSGKPLLLRLLITVSVAVLIELRVRCFIQEVHVIHAGSCHLVQNASVVDIKIIVALLNDSILVEILLFAPILV